mgnify:FL=1|jgi:hypothetical protein
MAISEVKKEILPLFVWNDACENEVVDYSLENATNDASERDPSTTFLMLLTVRQESQSRRSWHWNHCSI